MFHCSFGPCYSKGGWSSYWINQIHWITEFALSTLLHWIALFTFWTTGPFTFCGIISPVNKTVTQAKKKIAFEKWSHTTFWQVLLNSLVVKQSEFPSVLKKPSIYLTMLQVTSDQLFFVTFCILYFCTWSTPKRIHWATGTCIWTDVILKDKYHSNYESSPDTII